jgi:hypothetical protein
MIMRMRCLALLLALFVALTFGVGCGSPAKLGRPDAVSEEVKDATTFNRDAELAIDAAIDGGVLPEVGTEIGSASEAGVEIADTALPSDRTPDVPLPIDVSFVDAPFAEIDAPAPLDDAGEADGDDDGWDARDADARDVSRESARRDSATDRLADAGGDTPANLVVPEVNGTIYGFHFGDTVFAVDASKGARVVTFSLGERNVLTAAKNASDINWGSTFWPSPQNDWSWPPPTEIDSGAYTASLSGATLTMTGATATALGLSVTKIFTVDGVAGVVNIEYRLTNRGTQRRSVAPWEISRVAAGGLTFFPMGQGAPSKGSPPLLQLELSGGAAWLNYTASAITEGQKVLADGSEGWIAHAAGNLLFVKSFGDITPAQAAPAEAEVELYADPTHSYVEVENQGALTNLAAGASLAWTVRWFLREIDPAVPVEVGSEALLSATRVLVLTP